MQSNGLASNIKYYYY